MTLSVLCVLSCGAPSDPSATTSPTSPRLTGQINPARIDRVRADLPAGYETADLAGPTTPAAFWGFGAEWTAEPPRCGDLADPTADAARGWSGSGSGGIVYAAVAPARPLNPALLDDCAFWTMSGGQTTGRVTLTSAPEIDGAATVAMVAAATTVVEGGTETHSHAETLSAYLNDHVAFVTVVTDPGSPNLQLGQGFAATLLVETVSALRG